MGFKVRKSYKFGSARINVSKSGIGYSVGGKGLRYTKKAGGGHRTTASIPGTGISYTKDYSGKSGKRNSQTAFSGGIGARKRKPGTIRIIAGIVYIVWAIYSINSNVVHTIIAACVGAACIAWGYSARKKHEHSNPKTDLQKKLEALTDEEFIEYKETLLRYVQGDKDSATSPDMQKLIKAVREEDERRGAQSD